MGKRGGKRPGAGRKPKALTEIKARAIAEASDDARYALGLVIAVLQDVSQDMDLRLDCAQEVMDRVWGKPKQVQELQSDGFRLLLDK